MMSHLDEGTLHALLDGELDLHEVKEIQAHIGSCTACGTRLREVKEFHGESDRLVGLLEMPTAPSRRTAPADPEPGPFGDSPVDRRRTPRNLPRISGQVNEPPPLLLPENPSYRSGGLIRRMRWAALLLVTVGAGYMASQMRRPSNFAFQGELAPSRLGDSTPTAVLSSEEDASGTPVAGTRESAAVANQSPPPVAAKTTTAPRRDSPRPQPAAPPPEPQASAPEAPASADERRDEATEEATDLAAAGAAAEYDSETVEQENEPAGQVVPAGERRNVREEAALALRQLDRERQVERAAAATAALDSIRQRETRARQVTAAPPPAPRTPEQRAAIYLRIGLDEAAKQLGRPVHVIEGMSPMFMGLVLGRNSPGADATRPVVRVVYQDSQGRLIFLDQQRIRPGQATEEPRWLQGEIALRLGGEVGPEILRNYRGRVR
jgi:anti-sigma factor RsiW